MSICLFVDECGQDRREAPYQVLAGVAIEDQQIWNLTVAIHREEEIHFGRRISLNTRELKGRVLLKTKTFKLAAQTDRIEDLERRRSLARSLIEKGLLGVGGPKPTAVELTAYTQAKIDFAHRILELSASFGARVFASIVDRAAPTQAFDFLRKDYSYLFERFFYYLDGRQMQEQGIVVFDELEKTQCHVLVNQMERYFVETSRGQLRATRIVPEPFFVHSDLTTLIQVADMVAYVTSFAVRLPTMKEPVREELRPFAQQVLGMRVRSVIDKDGEPFYVWSLAHIPDLRPKSEKKKGGPPGTQQ